MTDYIPPSSDDNRWDIPASPPPASPPPGRPPPGSWAPQPGLPPVPPAGQEPWPSPGPPPPPGAGYSPFPTTPPPGAPSKGGRGQALKIGAGVLVAAIVGLLIIGSLVDDTTSAAFIDVGDCFADFAQFEATPAGGQDQTVDVVDNADCGEPHALEAYYVGGAYEGIDGTYDQDTIDRIAIATCETEFEAFVNFGWETSELDYWWLTPSPEGWSAGDRELICLVGDYERDLTVGTLEGAGR